LDNTNISNKRIRFITALEFTSEYGHYICLRTNRLWTIYTEYESITIIVLGPSLKILKRFQCT